MYMPCQRVKCEMNMGMLVDLCLVMSWVQRSRFSELFVNQLASIHNARVAGKSCNLHIPHSPSVFIARAVKDSI